MNFRRAFERGEDSFQLAPLIDILFLLLIFLLVTGALAEQERETRVELPKTTAAITRQRDRMDIIVNITRDGRLWINNRLYSVSELRDTLAQMKRLGAVSVIVRADGKALHEDVIKVIDACAALKLRNVSFVSINAARRPAN